MNAAKLTAAVSSYQELLAAWNARDATRFAAAFTPDGNAVGFDGSPMNGREEIATTLAEIFGHHPTAAYVSIVREVRALDERVTLIRAVVGMVPPGKTEINPQTNAIQSIVITGDSNAQIALLHNTPAAFHGRPHLAEDLTRELAAALKSGKTVTVPVLG